tara:strand:- start:387 stop:644 length:258 start_codon:yes stop_codon:yes gene_type:complete
MFNTLLKIFYFILITLFFYFVLSTYFSKDNVYKIQDRILNEERKSKIQSYNLPTLKNDTNNIIVYNSEEFIEKKIKKRKIWELLK